MAEVIAFPRRKTCFACQHYDIADEMGRCQIFDCVIDSEIFAAQDCHAFEWDQDAR